MEYTIIQVLVSYDFACYLSEEMKRNLVNLDSDEFRYSSYMWWLIVDQHIQYFIGRALKLTSLTFLNSITLVDIRLSSMMKKHGNAYSFSKHFAYPTLRILIQRFLPRLSKEIRDELKVDTKDWYFLKDKIMVLRNRLFDKPFLFSKHPLELWLA